MSEYPPEITERHVGNPEQQLAGWVGGATPPSQPIVIVDPDSEWPSWFAGEAARVIEVLGDVVIRLEHVGSTAVAGLPAKPIIDSTFRWPTVQQRTPTFRRLWTPGIV